MKPSRTWQARCAADTTWLRTNSKRWKVEILRSTSKNPGPDGSYASRELHGLKSPGVTFAEEMSRIHQLPLDDALSTLRSTPAGLSRAEAAARRLEFGPNRIERLSRTSLPRRFAAQFTHFFAVLLWVAAALALVADLQMPGQGMATLAVAIVGVIVVNGLFAFWQESGPKQTMDALQRLLPHQVRVQRDGAVVVIPADDVVPGDVIALSAGDNVPADCRLLEAFGVRVNNATVTGEARPVSGTPASATRTTCCETGTSCSPAPR